MNVVPGLNDCSKLNLGMSKSLLDFINQVNIQDNEEKNIYIYIYRKKKIACIIYINLQVEHYVILPLMLAKLRIFGLLTGFVHISAKFSLEGIYAILISLFATYFLMK